MNNGHHIRAVGRDSAQNTQSDESSDQMVEQTSGEMTDDQVPEYADYDAETWEADEPRRMEWIAPALAVGVIVGWTALYGWAIRTDLLSAADANPAQWTRWIIDWSVPVLLVCVIWILTMRHSRAEATRFAETASLLSRESAELETRLTVVNRELSLAREFLGAQSLELESLGRVAGERLSKHADKLQNLIQHNGAQVEAIGSASETALGNMTRLRDDLPVVANSARDVSNQVGNAGRTAEVQLNKLITGFERLNQFGKASESQVNVLEKRVGSTLDGFEGQLARIEEFVATRFEALQANAESCREEIGTSEAAALTALQERMSVLQAETKAIGVTLREAETGAMAQLEQSRARFYDDVSKTVASLDTLDAKSADAAQKRQQQIDEESVRFEENLAARDRKLAEELHRRQENFETREAQASEVLAQRLADLDDAMAERREAQTAETEKLVAHSGAMGTELAKLEHLINRISAQSEMARASLSEGLGSLGDQLEEKRTALSATENQLAGLTEAGIRLLEIIQSGAKHSREDLPQAIESAAQNLGAVEQRATALSGLMFTTRQNADGLGDYLVRTSKQIEETDASIEALQTKLTEQSEDALARLQGLRTGFALLSQESDAFAGESQERLREALGTLEAATQTAFAALDEGAREKVGNLANTLSKEAVAELERALRNESAESIGKLEQAAAHASGVGREAAGQLRDQLTKVSELTVNLEQRVSRARELAEEQVGNDFARRMALITDSLNSHAIDIAGALSDDISDTAWDAYLKGDRGIFTRRAVRLVDNNEAREIADLYQQDETFKANVSRYIHDFEKMLRSMLSTRDGNALSVTLLGSDMGKLYVALAQSIERFRN